MLRVQFGSKAVHYQSDVLLGGEFIPKYLPYDESPHPFSVFLLVQPFQHSQALESSTSQVILALQAFFITSFKYKQTNIIHLIHLIKKIRNRNKKGRSVLVLRSWFIFEGFLKILQLRQKALIRWSIFSLPFDKRKSLLKAKFILSHKISNNNSRTPRFAHATMHQNSMFLRESTFNELKATIKKLTNIFPMIIPDQYLKVVKMIREEFF